MYSYKSLRKVVLQKYSIHDYGVLVSDLFKGLWGKVIDGTKCSSNTVVESRVGNAYIARLFVA